MIVGLVECKSDELGAWADGFDHPSGRGGIRLAQIDKDDIGLFRGDFRDATRVQVDCIDHRDVIASAQGRS